MSFAGKPPQPRPTATPAAARARFAELADRDRGGISAAGRSRLLGGGGRAPLAVVLLHGLTNAPEQWLRFAEEARARGMAAVVPRFPGHGHTDRSARRLGNVPGEAYLRAASDAVDIACGIGDRVAIVGLSIGSGIGLRVALGRDDVASVVAAVPLLGIKGLARPVDEAWRSRSRACRTPRSRGIRGGGPIRPARRGPILVSRRARSAGRLLSVSPSSGHPYRRPPA